MIEFRTLGSIDLRGPAGRELEPILKGSNRVGILAYLAIRAPRGFQRRDTLTALFWPELDQAHARHALRNTLLFLRRSLGPGVLVNRGDEELGLAEGQLWCDAVAFEEALQAEELERALELYTGELLPGFFLADAPEFERWLEAERSRLARCAADAAGVLSQQAEAAEDMVRAERHARRALELAPHEESAARRLVALLDRLGDRGAAIDAYEHFERRLSAELEVEPSPETRKLFEEIRARHRVIDVPAATAASPPRAMPDRGRGGPKRRSLRAGPVRRRILTAAAIVIVVAVAGSIAIRPGPGGPALDPQRILVREFENVSGEDDLRELSVLAADWITQGLSYTGFVDVFTTATPFFPFQAVSETPASEWQDLAGQLGTGTVVSGLVVTLSDSVEFRPTIIEATTGRVLASVEPVKGSRAHPRAALEELRDRVMTALAVLTDPRLATWMEHASKPPTFEVYREFVMGLDLYMVGDSEAVKHFERAIQMDSTFAQAALWLSMTHKNHTRERGKAEAIVRELSQRRDRLAPLDRYFLDAQLAWYRRDWPGHLQAWRRAVEVAPTSDYLKNAGFAALFVNRPHEAVSYYERADPESGWLKNWSRFWFDFQRAHHLAGNYEEALRVARQGRARFPNSWRAPWAEVEALAALGRSEELYTLIERTRSRPPLKTWWGSTWSTAAGHAISTGVWELRAHGHLRAADEIADRALEWYPGGAAPASVGDSLYLTEILLARGRLAEARALSESLHFPNPARKHRLAGVIAARLGDRDAALQEIAALESSGSGDSPRPNRSAKVWIAGIRAHLGERDEAIQLLTEVIADGWTGWYDSHKDWLFEPLWDYPPFQRLVQPPSPSSAP